ncbi:MAG: TIM barrel protein [Oscillospiraceae bacterium]|nr:TIM barrel protein [Oscillospiraceae bacterium]
MVKFGTAGLDENFSLQGHKKTIEVPTYLSNMGLDAFEYQCGRGVKIKEAAAVEFGKEAAAKGITLSLHAPYYISMSSLEEEKRLNSVGYILDSAKAIKAMGGKRVIFHSGSCAKLPREAALAKAVDTMGLIMKALDENGLGDITVCPETMGKVNQLGTLDEVLTLCKVDERIIPCIDFGHLNARDMGIIKTMADYEAIINKMENEIGADRTKVFHSHFSKIEYTTGGEKRHLTFEDTAFGPDFEPLMEIIARKNLAPTIICESDGTQGIDALAMKNYFYKLK